MVSKKNRTIALSFTVTYDVELEGAQCGNCGEHTPDPPRERLEYVIKEHYKKNRFLHPETVIAKTFVLKAGPNQWADWLPEGWTAGQHAKVPLLCPRCTAAIVDALARSRMTLADKVRELRELGAMIDEPPSEEEAKREKVIEQRPSLEERMADPANKEAIDQITKVIRGSSKAMDLVRRLKATSTGASVVIADDLEAKKTDDEA